MSDLYRIDEHPDLHELPEDGGMWVHHLGKQVGTLVLVEPEETIKWCFAHHRNWWGSNGCGFRTRREDERVCDRDTAVIVRIEA